MRGGTGEILQIGFILSLAGVVNGEESEVITDGKEMSSTVMCCLIRRK